MTTVKRTIHYSDGLIETRAVDDPVFGVTVELSFGDEGRQAPAHVLDIREAESLINLLRQAVAQAREINATSWRR